MSNNINQEFDEEQKKLETLKQDTKTAIKLKIYGLFKQIPIVTRIYNKWDAWNSLGKMSSGEEKQQYVNLVKELTTAQQTSSTGQYGSIIIYSKAGGYATITLNRPKKKNALDLKAYDEISSALQDADNDPNVKFLVMTGAGDFYCSGNDLSNFQTSTGDLSEDAKRGAEQVRKYVASYIEFNKPLVGVVNGHAVGIAVTVLGLFDLVYATDRATFHTPFSALGLSPEGCSSYTFPKLMGGAKANELLMLGRKLNASEAYDRGLVTEVFPDHSFHKEVAVRLNKMSALPEKSLFYSKQVLRNKQKELLHKINIEECNNLIERFQSEECMMAVMAFLNKSKL